MLDLALALCLAPQDPPFEPRAPFAIGPQAGRPELVDFDRDGDLDVLVACGACCGNEPDPEAGVVRLLRNDAKGRFAMDREAVSVGATARKLAVGDLDGDGFADVLVAEHDDYTVTALRNDAGKRLVPFAGSPFASMDGKRPHTHEVALADLDGDGHLDCLTTNVADNAIAVLRGTGAGAFARVTGSPFATPWRHPYDALAIADFDGDGDLDVASPMLRDGCVALLRGDRTGALTAGERDRSRVLDRPGYAVHGDLDRDGDEDLVVAHDDSGVLAVLTNDGKGAFAVAQIDTGIGRWGLALGDLDGDGIHDLAAAPQGGSDVAILRGDGKGAFAPWTSLRASAQSSYVALGDVTGDGRLDVVATSYETGEGFVFARR